MRLHAREHFTQAGAVDQIAIMEENPGVGAVRIDVEVFDPGGIERTAAADDAMHLISFLQKEFGEVRTVLSGNSGDQCPFACSVLHGFITRFCHIAIVAAGTSALKALRFIGRRGIGVRGSGFGMMGTRSSGRIQTSSFLLRIIAEGGSPGLGALHVRAQKTDPRSPPPHSRFSHGLLTSD